MSAATSQEAVIQAELEKFWDQEMDADEGEESLFPVDSEMDSATAVLVLIGLAIRLDVDEIPVKVVRKGGYESKDDFIKTLSASVVAHLEEAKAKKAKA